MAVLSERMLEAEGKLVKITRGRYALPITRRFGTRRPAPEVVIVQLNRDGAQQLVSSGAAAAHALGPIPGCRCSRPSWPAPSARSAFLLPHRPAGLASRALIWLGLDQATAALPILQRVLPPVEWAARDQRSSEGEL